MITIQDCIIPCGLIILLFFSAFFSGAETALTSLTKIRLTRLKRQNRRHTAKLLKVLAPKSFYLDVILIGNNIVNTAASAMATAFAIQLFGTKGTGIATAVMTVVIIIFGEILPKSAASEDPETRALSVAPSVLFLSKILRPLAKLLAAVTDCFISPLLRFGRQMPAITEEELQSALTEENVHGLFETAGTAMVNNVFDFSDQPVKKAMTSRTRLKGIAADAPYAAVRERFQKTGFSRLPVYRDSLDRIIGIIHYKDFLYYTGSKETYAPSMQAHPPLYIPETAQLSKVQELMRASKQSLVVVIDEHGGTAGIVTIEDVVEEIFGGLTDEYDKQDAFVRPGVKISENVYRIPGKMPLEQLNTLLGTDFDSQFYETVGGFLLEHFCYLPKTGEKLRIGNTLFMIEQTGRQRIERIIATILPPSKEGVKQ